MLPQQLPGQWPGTVGTWPWGPKRHSPLCPSTPRQCTRSHLKFGGNEDGGGANELQLVPHAHHLHQVVVHQLHGQVQSLMVQLKVLLQGYGQEGVSGRS